MKQNRIARTIVAVFLAVALFLTPLHAAPARAQSAVIHVRVNGVTATPCGGGWLLADPDPAMRPCALDTALSIAVSGDEIWAAEGVYIPTRPADPADPRSATFTLPDGVKLYGGYSPTETNTHYYDPYAYLTVLSGDLDQNDLARPAKTWADIQGANVYHVVEIRQAGPATVLNGIIISGGDASGTAIGDGGPTFGGGLNLINSSPTLTNVIITGHRASDSGGGISITGAGSPTLNDVKISGCRANSGAGLMAKLIPQLTLTGVQIKENEAVAEGAGAVFVGVDASLENVRFENNKAPTGAGLRIFRGVTRINRAVFASNTGGAISIENTSLLTVSNATFHNNTAQLGALAELIGQSRAYFTHITAYDNRAANYNGIISVSKSGVSIRDSAFSMNGHIISGGGYNFAEITNTWLLDACPAGVTCTGLIKTGNEGIGVFAPFTSTAGHPLRPGSALIDRAPCTDIIPDGAGGVKTIPLAVDQRGTARSHGTACDLGAFEYSPRILYVQAHYESGPWHNIYKDLQPALLDSAPGDQIWVARGTYFPTTDPNDRAASFVLREGVEIYGGFRGDEYALEERDLDYNPTTLSGNIDRSLEFPFRDSYHVVFSDQHFTPPSVLDGFIITRGEANGPLTPDGSNINQKGGGIYIENNQAELRNLVIKDNRAIIGGGMWNNGFSHLSNVLFQDNLAEEYGGGLANGDQPMPDWQHAQLAAILTNVTFAENESWHAGGAIANLGVRSLYDPPYVTQPDMVHVTFNQNTAGLGNNLYLAGSGQVIANSILWDGGNRTSIYQDANSSLAILNSIVIGGCPSGVICNGVSQSDPRLRPLDASFGIIKTYALSPRSSAIDAANPEYCKYIVFTGTFTNERLPLTTDQRGAPRPSGAGCDLGAHEFNAHLSIVSGNNQSTSAFTPFPESLVVRADSFWRDTVEGMMVRFIPDASAAGGTVSSPTALITSGQASVTATAQYAPGFTVQASAPGVSPVIFHLNVSDTVVTLTASPQSANAGQPVTLTARVEGKLPGVTTPPTGSVTIMDGDAALLTIPLFPASPPGSPITEGTTAISNLSIGEHALTATFSGDATYKAVTTSPVVPVTVDVAVAAVQLGSLAQTYSGTPRAITVTTDPPGLPVRVTYDGSETPPLKAGSYAVLAEITDPNYSGSATGTLVVSKAKLDVSAISVTRPYGLTNPAFTHELRGFVNGEGPEVIQGAPVLTCSATPTSPVGSYTIETSSGSLASENYYFSLWNNKLYIIQAATTVQLTASPNPATYGQPVTLTTTVQGPEGSVVSPTGNVSFLIDGAHVQTATLDSEGKATFSTHSLNAGPHSIQAQYAGNTNHKSSSSAQSSVQINRAAASVTLNGQHYTYDGKPHGATITTSPAGLATTITYDGSAAQPVNAGSYAVAVEISDPNYTGSAAGTLVIDKAGVAIRLELPQSPIHAGDPVTLTVVVSANNDALPEGIHPTGSVVFEIPGKPAVTAPLAADGTAIYAPASLPPGSYAISARYSGDANFAEAGPAEGLLIIEWLKLYAPLVWH